MAKIGLGNSMPSVLKFANIMKTLWYLIIFGSASVYSRDIYPSINWDPRKYLVSASLSTIFEGVSQT